MLRSAFVLVPKTVLSGSHGASRKGSPGGHHVNPLQFQEVYVTAARSGKPGLKEATRARALTAQNGQLPLTGGVSPLVCGYT